MRKLTLKFRSKLTDQIIVHEVECIANGIFETKFLIFEVADEQVFLIGGRSNFLGSSEMWMAKDTPHYYDPKKCIGNCAELT